MTEQIYFNPKEVNYLRDQDFLITKRKITDKIFSLLVGVQDTLAPILENYQSKIPKKVLTIAGKISKGENYRDLPYLMLDYPRYFKKNDTFAFRTMFWWGNYFSITLHLQGESLHLFRDNMIRRIATWSQNNYYICINETPWEYHFEQDNYIPLVNLSEEKIEAILQKHEFIKISTRIGLEEFSQLNNKAVDFVETMLSTL